MKERWGSTLVVHWVTASLLIFSPFDQVRQWWTVEARAHCEERRTCAECVGIRRHHQGAQSQATAADGEGRFQDPVVLSRQLSSQGNGGELRLPFSRKSCVWCPEEATCKLAKIRRGGSAVSADACSRGRIGNRYGHGDQPVIFHSQCPLSPSRYPDEPPDFLPHWMGELGPLLRNLTLLDLSLPATHDTISYDSSLIMSDAGLDDLWNLDKILHDITGGHTTIVPKRVLEFVRQQAKTQQLSVNQQLDNGVRFLDFRIMMEKEKEEWYSLHALQSKHPVEHYFHEIRKWLDSHPSEIVVVWFSRHGSTCRTGKDQYPGVTLDHKRKFWNAFTAVFDGVLIDTAITKINETSLETMLERGHRLVPYVSDYDEMTASAPNRALDGCLVDNRYYDENGVNNLAHTLSSIRSSFGGAADVKRGLKPQQGFLLLAMITSSPPFQVEAQAKLRFSPNPFTKTEIRKKCAANFHIPAMDSWCPTTLLDVSQLTSYYNQIVLDEAVTNLTMLSEAAGSHASSWSFPNAIYVDALDYDGTVRTGTEILYGSVDTTETSSGHLASRYSFVDSILLYNVEVACALTKSAFGGQEPGRFRNDSSSLRRGNETDCARMRNVIHRRREKYAKEMWDEPQRGRLLAGWPHSSYNFVQTSQDGNEE